MLLLGSRLSSMFPVAQFSNARKRKKTENLIALEEFGVCQQNCR